MDEAQPRADLGRDGERRAEPDPEQEQSTRDGNVAPVGAGSRGTKEEHSPGTAQAPPPEWPS